MQTVEDVLDLLDVLFDETADRWTDRNGAGWWDRFYADRERAVPFFRWAPDESLAAWQEGGRLGLGPGKAPERCATRFRRCLLYTSPSPRD